MKQINLSNSLAHTFKNCKYHIMFTSKDRRTGSFKKLKTQKYFTHSLGAQNL
ncbi:MAG: hypothetical protein IJ837_00350 [Clostridia bacterium]|nr:hypothetical protein [Clostridia bacterium]